MTIATLPGESSDGSKVLDQAMQIFTEKFEADVKAQMVSIATGAAGTWHQKETYKENSPRKIAELALISTRLVKYMPLSTAPHQVNSNFTRAKHYRSRVDQHNARAGADFLVFISDFLKVVRGDIKKIHKGVCGLYAHVAKPSATITDRLSFETQEAHNTSVGICATYKVECDRLLKLFTKTMPGAFMSQVVPDKDGAPTTMVRVCMLPGYCFEATSYRDFDSLRLHDFVNNYLSSVRLCIVAIEIRRTFEAILRCREEYVKRTIGAQLVTQPYIDAYDAFSGVFAPFFDDNDIIYTPPHVMRLHHIVVEVTQVFSDILMTNAPGNEFMGHEFERHMDESEKKTAITSNAPRTCFPPSNFLAVLEKIASTSVVRRSPKFERDLLARAQK